MKTFTQKLYTFSCSFVQIFFLLLAGLLFLGGFLFTCYCSDMNTMAVETRWDNPLWNLLWIALSLGFMVTLSGIAYRARLRTEKFPDPCDLLTVIVLLWCLAFGGLLILFGRSAPAADSMTVYSMAEELASGQYLAIHPTDSYLSYYPHQVGLTAFFEILIRIYRLLPVNLAPYHFIKCIYVLLACSTVLSLRGITRILWADRRAEFFYLLMAGANLPFLMYTSYVYGEIPSFAAVCAGLCFLLRLLCQRPSTRKRCIGDALASLLFLTLGVMLRKNNLIVIIAVLIVTTLQWLRQRRKALLVYGLLCALCSLSVLPLVKKSYELRADNRLSSGVPAISYLAMGMQEAPCANGWYNGFNFNTYHDSGLDTAKTVEISQKAIRDRLEYFRAHPGYTADFYIRKHLSQWADGTYTCRQVTLNTFGARSPFLVSLYEGEYSRFFIGFANIYQNILYFGVLVFCIASLRKPYRNGLPEALGLIGAIGGFLFHIFWEASSRYVLLYSLLLMPYCARGISLLAGRLSFLSNNSPHRDICRHTDFR